MNPYPHQLKIAKEAIQILKNNLIVYLAMEERTGKTLTSLLICEEVKVSNVPIITKNIVTWNYKRCGGCGVYKNRKLQSRQ